MDPSRVARNQSSQVLMQIQGSRIGYLRCFSLVDTDGTQWQRPTPPPLRRMEFHTRKEMARFPHRLVRVKNPAFLGRAFPVDGNVLYLAGNFFQSAWHNAYGGVECTTSWHSINSFYEYWMDPSLRPNPPLPALARA